jgi:hypothetical protein
MLLTMAGLMVVMVWLVSHVHEATLPPIDLPHSTESRLGSTDRSSASVTLRPAATAGAVDVWLDDEPVVGQLAGLESALATSGAGSVTLRVDAVTPWAQALAAMTIVSGLDLEIQVAAVR